MTVASNSLDETDSEAARALQIIESMPGFAWLADVAGQFTYVSPNTLAFLGNPREDLNTSEDKDEFGWLRFVHPDDYDRVAARWRHCLETGEHYDTEHRLRRADGVYRWFRNSGRPSRDSQGRITQWYGTTIDIEDQKQAEAALRDRERELSQLVDMVPSHLWRLAPDGEPIFFNKRMVDFLGLDVADTDKPGMSRLEAVIETVHPDDAAKFKDALSRCLVTGERFSMRYRLRRSDGVYRWMSSRAEPLRDPDGRIVQWYGLCHDIDDQMHAEEALRRSERQLQQMIDAVPVRAFSTTPTGGPVYFNKRYEDYLRTVIPNFDDLEEPRIAKLVQDLLHPEDAPEVQRSVRHCFETGAPFVMRYRRRDKDGAFRWAEGRMEPLRDQDGVIVQWYGINLDIDDGMRAQEALRDRERELSQLVDMVPSLLWRLTPDGEPNFFNKRLIDFFGLDIADADKPDTSRLAAIIETFAHPDDAAGLAEALNHSIVTGQRFSMRYRLRRADGVYRWVDGRAEPLRDQGGCIVQWYGLSHDIDDQLRAQEALRESERQLQQLIDTVPAMIWSTTPKGTPAYVNRRFTDVTGVMLEGIAATDGAPSLSVIHPDDVDAAHQAVGHSFATGEAYVQRYRQLRADGSYRWTETRAEPLRDESGNILQWYGVSVDIHDLVMVQEALRESERSLRQLVETLPAMIDCAAPDGEPIYRSQQLSKFLGYNLEDLDEARKSRLAGTLDAGVHPDDLAGVKERYAHSLSTGEPYARKHRLRRFDGEYRWVETRAAAMCNAEGAIVQWNVICLDIEDQVRAQEELRLAQESLARASQAASLAELSASIAHEVNQPLAAVVANSHACQRWLTAEPPNIERARKTVERITRDANAAADVVSRIRALFKQSVGPRNCTTLGGVIAEARDLMAEEAARRSVRMDVEVESDLPLVAFDRVQIQQVLINLVRNGMEAMDSVTSDRALRMRVRRMGDAAQAEISDRGRGVEFPDRIFEPFFTTKEHGMGMGLAICRSIVESHGGRLWTEKNEPRGTTFIFTLPVEAKTAP